MSGKHRMGVPIAETPYENTQVAGTADTVDVPRWTPEAEASNHSWAMATSATDSLPDPTQPPTDPPTDPPAAPEPPAAPQQPQYSSPRSAADPWRFANPLP